MSDQAAKSTKPRPPSRLGKGPTSSSWKPGQSGNPGGRPRKALAAVDAIREDVNPHEWVAQTLVVARDLERPWSERSAAWLSLIDRGFVKPPVGLEASVTHGGASDDDYDGVPIEKLRELQAAHRAALAMGHQPNGVSTTNETEDDGAPSACPPETDGGS